MLCDQNFLFFLKGSEKYLFFYDDEPESVKCLAEIFNKYALDDKYNFSEDNASFLSKKVEELKEDLLISKNRLEDMFKKCS